MPANAGINERIGCQYQGMAGTYRCAFIAS